MAKCTCNCEQCGDPGCHDDVRGCCAYVGPEALTYQKPIGEWFITRFECCSYKEVGPFFSRDEAFMMQAVALARPIQYDKLSAKAKELVELHTKMAATWERGLEFRAYDGKVWLLLCHKDRRSSKDRYIQVS